MQPLHGLLLVDKPAGITSHDVVGRVRKLLNDKSVGHSGTLDPLATGLMVLLVGQGTKLSDYLRGGDKGYEVKVKFGIETDTLDITGQIKNQHEVSLDPAIVREAVHSAQGRLKLPVPMFSAVKVKGKKLYEYAREETLMAAPVREMEFTHVEVGSAGPDSVTASVKCTKGGYIRAWAVHVAERLNTYGVVEVLRRTWSQPYGIDCALTLEELEIHCETLRVQPERAPAEVLGKSYVPLAEALPEWKALMIKGKDERLLMHGQIPHELGRRLIYEQKHANRTQTPVGVKVLGASRGGLISLLEIQPFKGPKIKRIFNA